MRTLIIASLILIGLHAYAQDKSGPLYADLNLPQDERLIEPTSPVLGNLLVETIKQDQRAPELILKDLKEKHPQLNRELRLSSMAYFKTVVKPLREYCQTEQKEEANDKAIAVVETGAIPVEILKPMHEQYKQNLATLRERYENKSDSQVEDMAYQTAVSYQMERYNCNVVQKLNQMEDKIKKVLPKRLDRLVDLHHRVSAAEAAFPRIQFSVNGFTQFVFNEILKLPYETLAGLLKVTYEGQVEWIARKEKGEDAGRYFTFFEEKALKAGYLPRDILLILAYSTRNMPSIDVHYGYDTDKALLLEVYFWKMHAHRDYVTKRYEVDIFPNHVMKRNPGLYHYATSALLACEVRLNGFSGAMARVIALGNKVGYKVHKLLGEMAGKEGKKSLKEIRETAKRQAFGPGVDAGLYGGSHGLKFCRKNTPKKLWPKNNKDASLPEELEAEDLSPELEEALQ